MRALLWATVLAALAALAPPPAPVRRLVLVGGTPGHLEPCGCTKPMSGGLARRMTVLRALAGDGTMVVDVGPVVSAPGRQSEMKLETLAEAMADVGPWALALGPDEAALGEGALLGPQRLGAGGLASLGLGGTTAVATDLVVGNGFVVGVLAPEPALIAGPLSVIPRQVQDQLALLRLAAKGTVAVLVAPVGIEEARRLATENPWLGFVVYRSSGRPPTTLERVGETRLATPGDRGRYVLAIDLPTGAAPVVRVIELGEGVKDDATAREVLRRYQQRVAAEDLLAAAPRLPGERFAGNKACSSCHAGAAAVWDDSRHARALETLERIGVDRDPDCVGCHVVGLESSEGFRDRAATPNLSDVGCESCHGPGARHAQLPMEARMGKVGKASCAPCHSPDHSPNFDFDAYWKKIAH